MHSSPLPESELGALKRLICRCALLSLPFVIWQLLELFVLPIDFFTFRVWEAALASPERYPGPYYPNLHVLKENEYGDYYREGARYRKRKRVAWYIDNFGWRNRPSVEQSPLYDVVVLGDSNIVGSYLDQKDTLSEVLMRNAFSTVYSYAYSHDHISFVFSDERVLAKSPKLFVIESKAGNWFSTGDYLTNFIMLDDGNLQLRDRSEEFKTYFYDTRRSRVVEKLKTRIGKQPALHWAKSTLATEFNVRKRVQQAIFGLPAIGGAEGNGWRPVHPELYSKKTKRKNGLPEKPNDTSAFRVTGKGAYWRSGAFAPIGPDREVRIRFRARNSVVPTNHRVWIKEGHNQRTVGEIALTREWRSFDIPVSVPAGETLEIQIDQMDGWQWLLVADFQVENATDIPDESASAHRSDERVSQRAGTEPYIEKPASLPPLDGQRRVLSVPEAQYYFYLASKSLQRHAAERNADAIILLMPDTASGPLMPAVRQLRAEGVKVIAYEPTAKWPTGVDYGWFWSRFDSHWTEGAVRLVGDEIARMAKEGKVENRPFSDEMKARYSEMPKDPAKH